MPDQPGVIHAFAVGQRLVIEADDAGERRVIAGTAVPYDRVGMTNVGCVKFLAGSLPSPDGIPVVRGHDEASVIGVVRGSTSSDESVYVRTRISKTGSGDDVLALAEDNAITGFSVAVDPVEFSYEQSDEHGMVLVVAEGKWRHLGVVPFPAFDGARIDRVAASQPTQEVQVPDTTVQPEPVVTATAPTESGPTTVPLHASAPPPAQSMSLRGLSTIIASQGGDPQRIQAALANVTTGSMAGLVAPQYVDDLVGIIKVGRPAVDAFAQRNLTGSPIMHPRWKTLGLVDVQATQKTQIASGPAEIEWVTLQTPTYAGGNDLSIQVIDWGRPDAIETYLSMMAEVYARKTEAAFEAGLIAAATSGGITSGDMIEDIGAAFGMVASTGLVPNLILTAGDIYGTLWTNLAKIGPGLFSAVNGGFPVPRVVIMPFATAGTLLVSSSQAAVTYENQNAPVNIRVVDVSLLGVDLGVYGYFQFAVDYPTALISVGALAGTTRQSDEKNEK